MTSSLIDKFTNNKICNANKNIGVHDMNFIGKLCDNVFFINAINAIYVIVSMLQ